MSNIRQAPSAHVNRPVIGRNTAKAPLPPLKVPIVVVPPGSQPLSDTQRQRKDSSEHQDRFLTVKYAGNYPNYLPPTHMPPPSRLRRTEPPQRLQPSQGQDGVPGTGESKPLLCRHRQITCRDER